MSSLDPALWHALQPWLDRALDLPAGESRDALLQAVREEAPEIAETLEALLRGEGDPNTLTALGVTIADLLGELPTLSGQRIGAYVLDAPLGQGGMGTVYLARRADGAFDGSAAVKLLHVGAIGGARADRFRREATMLATLNHPNIAQLLDAGVTEVGQPYLVLEHVNGTRIDQHCREHRCPVDARLRLLLQVGAAVSAAHARLIVHRDIKPANILVTDDGIVKLLDFGIARLVGAGRGLGQASTDSGLALTPEYAAPEQLKGEPLTTAVDVYALGVLLHLLLTGEHPTGAGCTTPAEHLRAVLEVEPVRLSEAVATSRTRTPAEIARHADSVGESASALRDRYRGDLETIVERALHKEPTARYPSVAAFCDDLDRYLTHRPILARATTVTDRARKFVRRHRVPVAAAALAVVSLVGATVFSAQQAREARAQRDEALFLSRKSGALADLQAILATASTGPDGAPEPLSAVVQRAEASLRAQYPNEPRLAAEVLVELSSTLADNGYLEEELALLGTALAAAVQSGATETIALVQCIRGQVLLTVRGLPNALDSAKAALADAEAVRTRSATRALNTDAFCLAGQAAVLAAGESPDSAATALRAAIGLLEQAGETNDTRYAQMLHDLGRTLRAGARFREAVVPATKVVAQFERTARVETPAMARVVANLVQPLWNLGEMTQAHDVLARLVRRQEATWGAGRTHSLMAYWYGLSHQYLGQLDSAQQWMTRAVSDTSADGQEAAMVAAPMLAVVRTLRGESPEPYLARASAPGGMMARAGAATRALVAAHMAAYTTPGARGAADAVGVLQGAVGLRPDTLPRAWANTLLFGARQAALAGDEALALTWARATARIAVVDSLAATESAMVGRAEWLVAAQQQRAGQTGEARAAITRALPALRHGLGADHPETVAAVTALAALPPS